jgi:hypothetical protein
MPKLCIWRRRGFRLGGVLQGRTDRHSRFSDVAQAVPYIAVEAPCQESPDRRGPIHQQQVYYFSGKGEVEDHKLTFSRSGCRFSTAVCGGLRQKQVLGKPCQSWRTIFSSEL